MRELGFEIISLESGVCVAKVPYQTELVGDPLTCVLHGGVVTSLLDSTGGAAVLSKIQNPIALATLDLRIDYLRPAVGPHFELHAQVLRLGSRVASTRMEFLGADGKLLSAGAGAYMIA